MDNIKLIQILVRFFHHLSLTAHYLLSIFQSHFRSFTPILFTQARIIRLSLAPHYLGFEDDCLSRCPIDNCLNPKQPKQCPGPEEVNQQQINRHEGHHAVAHQGAFVLFLPKSHAQDTRQDHTH